MRKNIIHTVAELYGKKYYEEFTITNDSSDYYECRAKFTEWGLMCLIDDLWQISETVLNDLLVGEAEIKDNGGE